MSKITIEKPKSTKAIKKETPVKESAPEIKTPVKELDVGFGDQGAYKLISKVTTSGQTIITKFFPLVGTGGIIHITTQMKDFIAVSTHFAEGAVVLESHDEQGRVLKRELKSKGR